MHTYVCNIKHCKNTNNNTTLKQHNKRRLGIYNEQSLPKDPALFIGGQLTSYKALLQRGHSKKIDVACKTSISRVNNTNTAVVRAERRYVLQLHEVRIVSGLSRTVQTERGQPSRSGVMRNVAHSTISLIAAQR